MRSIEYKWGRAGAELLSKRNQHQLLAEADIYFQALKGWQTALDLGQRVIRPCACEPTRSCCSPAGMHRCVRSSCRQAFVWRETGIRRSWLRMQVSLN